MNSLIALFRSNPEHLVALLGGGEDMGLAFAAVVRIQNDIDAIPQGVRASHWSTDEVFAKDHLRIAKDRLMQLIREA